MTSIVNLIKQWEELAGARPSAREYCVHLPLSSAARVAALVEMYPRRSEAELISELLTAALDELEIAMTYLPTRRAVDADAADQVEESPGPRPRFLDLSRKYRAALECQSDRVTQTDPAERAAGQA